MKFPIGLDINGNQEGIQNRTATVDNYAQAYLFTNPVTSQLFVQSKLAIPAGQSVTVNVTINMQDANGNQLPSVVAPFTFQGPPAAPLAVTISVTGEGATNFTGTDPGSATISF